MLISNDFKNLMASTFYDKLVYILENVATTDSEGDVISKGTERKSSFLGNVNFKNYKQVQENYGISYQIDVYITTSLEVKIKLGDIIEYDNTKYKVTDLLKSDSHIGIIGQIWQ